MKEAQNPYQKEANTFVQIMHNMAPGLHLDYTAASIDRLEAFITKQFDPPDSKYVSENLPIGVGCYVGEVIIRTLGGHWHHNQPEINNLGQVKRIFPLQKATKRFQNGPIDSLTTYYETVAKYGRLS